jgi:hypothetical protein
MEEAFLADRQPLEDVSTHLHTRALERSSLLQLVAAILCLPNIKNNGEYQRYFLSTYSVFLHSFWNTTLSNSAKLIRADGSLFSSTCRNTLRRLRSRLSRCNHSKFAINGRIEPTLNRREEHFLTRGTIANIINRKYSLVYTSN